VNTLSDRQIEQALLLAAEFDRAMDAATPIVENRACIAMSRLDAAATGLSRLTQAERRHLTACRRCESRLRGLGGSQPISTLPWVWRVAATATAAAAVLAAVTVLRGPAAAPIGWAPPIDFSLLDDSATSIVGSCMRGDANCDGTIDGKDVRAFVTAMHEPDAYSREFPDCDRLCSNDLNGDCAVDEHDLALLLACVPHQDFPPVMRR